MKTFGAWTWLQQGARQLGRSRVSTAILAISVAVSAAFFSAVLMAYLMLGHHYPAGATNASEFLSLGQGRSGQRHDPVDLNHFVALTQLPADDGRFFAANVGSSYPLESSGGKTVIRTGFASTGFLSALGVELVHGRWPSRQEVALSESTATSIYGSAASAIGEPIRVGAMDGIISGVFSNDFEGLHPAWDQATPTAAWMAQEDIFSVSGFSGQFPEDIQRQIPLFRIYLKPEKSSSTTQAAANAIQLISVNGMSGEKWEAVSGIFQGLAEHDSMTRILAPASVALIGLVLALLLAQIAHEARTIDGRARTVLLRTRLGASWTRIGWQEALTSAPLSALFAFVALIAASTFLYIANSEALALTQASPYTRRMLWQSILVPVLALPLLPVISRLMLLALLRGRPSGAPPRLAAVFLGTSVALGLLSGTLLLSLSRGTLPLLEQVDAEARKTTYLAADRSRSDVNAVSSAAVADLAASLRAEGVDVDVTSSAPFSKCDEIVSIRPTGSELASSVSVSLVSIGSGTASLLGMRLQEGALPGKGEIAVAQAVSNALGSSGSVGSRVTLPDGSDRTVSGIFKDSIFDAPSSDSAMRIFSTDTPSVCPSFMIVRQGEHSDLMRSTSAFTEAFGTVVSTNRAERAMQRLYAPIMLGKATLVASAAVLLAIAYLVAEALLAFLSANSRVFATMQSLGASGVEAGLQTWNRIYLQIGFAVMASALPLAGIWYLLQAQEVLLPRVVFETFAFVLAVILLTMLSLIAIWHQRRARQNISDMLRDE